MQEPKFNPKTKNSGSSFRSFLDCKISEAKTLRVYAIVNLGLEEVAREELERFSQQLGINFDGLEVHRGGIEFNASSADFQKLTEVAQTPTRFLIRVCEFIARDFPKLHKRLKTIPFASLFDGAELSEVRVATHGSRLKMKKRIAEMTEKSVKHALKSAVSQKKPAVAVFVRIENDLVVVSIDLEARLRHKTGERKDVGTASLRETYAAAMIQTLLQEVPKGTKINWLEPMAGTAVFIREYLRCSSAANLTTVLLCDTDSQQRRRLSQAVSLKVINEQLKISASWEEMQNSLVLTTGNDQLKNKEIRVLFINPPWGVRLRNGYDTPAKQARLILELERRFRPDFLSLLLPQIGGNELKLEPTDLYEFKNLPFKSGGIPVVARFYRRKE